MRDAHQSGHATATRKQHQRALAQLTATSSVFALTEARGVPAPAGWRRTSTETALMWDDARWLCHDQDVTRIDTPPWIRGTSHRRTVDLGWTFLEHRAHGRTLLRIGGHHPAHLDDADQAAANAAVLEQLAATLRDLSDRLQPDVLTYSADWNLDMRRAGNAATLASLARRSRLPLAPVVPPKPTLGRLRGRTIDAALTTVGRPLEVAMLDRVRGYDHRGFGFAPTRRT